MNSFWIILILGALNAITPFSIDLYLPAFPAIAKDLSTQVETISLTISTYFLGFSIGQILYGPLLDRFGRKKPVAFGLCIYILASLACSYCHTPRELMIWRFIQALGGSSASVASTAMVRDFFPVDQSAKVFSLMTLILGISPLLAPTIGGWISLAFGWHFIFVSLAVITAFILTCTLIFLPAGHPPDRSVKLAPKIIFADFYQIFKNADFFLYAITGSLSFSGLFVYVAGSPAIFLEGFKVSASVYGAIFAFLAIGMLTGSQLNLWLGKRYSNRLIFKTALQTQAVLGVLFLIFAIFIPANLSGTLTFLFLLLMCSGVTYPNAASLALAPFADNAGRASALLGFMQLGLGSLICSGVGISDYKGTLPTATVMAISAVMGLSLLLSKV
jgi:DHA1 family bicyclomycin/chloramphenicol resistance-like MFS transporter